MLKNQLLLTSFVGLFACLIFADATQAESTSKVILLKSDGSLVKEIFNSSEYDKVGSVCYSPDGKKIAFDAWRSSEDSSFVDTHIIVIDADGKNMRDLGDGAMPSWSPDSRQITFSRYKKENEKRWSNNGVWFMDADGKNRKMLDPEGWSSQWSPDGKAIAYTVHGKLVLYDTKSKKKERIVFPDKEYFQFIYWNVSWSADSQLLAFKSRTSKSTYEIASIHLPSKDTVIHYSTTKKDRPLEDTAWHPSGDIGLFLKRSNEKNSLKLFKFDPLDPDAKPELLKGQNFKDSVTSMSYHPDGQLIAATVRVEQNKAITPEPAEKKVSQVKKPVKQLAIMDADGKNLRVFFSSNEYTGVGSPKFSADGKKVTFDAWRAHKGESYNKSVVIVMNSDGTGLKELGEGTIPNFSPDGSKVTFSRYANENIGEQSVWISDIDGTNERMIESDAWSSIWSPDGSKIAFLHQWGRSSFRIYDVKTKEVSDLELPDRAQLVQAYWNFCWSPDSKKLCFRSESRNPTKYSIASIDIKSGDVIIHFEDEKKKPSHGIHWHPNGKQITFGLWTPEAKASRIHTLNLTEDKMPSLVPGQTFEGSYYNPSWSPDGKRIIFEMQNPTKKK